MERIVDDRDERMWGMFCHLASFAYFIPLGNIIGPLIIYLIKKDEYALVEDQGKEVMNFQITMTLFLFVSAILTAILIGILFLAAVGIFSLVFTIIGALKANEGVFYRYPLCIRFIK